MAIGLFIDGSYLYRISRKIDYIKLRTELERHLDDVIEEGYFFNADNDPPKAATTAFNKLLTQPPPDGPGLRVKIYWLHKEKLFWPQAYGGHPVMHPEKPQLQYEVTSQKAVDVGLAFHMIASYHRIKWNKLVLIAGDGDFSEPVQYLVETQNVALYIVGKRGSISTELLPYGKLIEIDQEPWRSNTLKK